MLLTSVSAWTSIRRRYPLSLALRKLVTSPGAEHRHDDDGRFAGNLVVYCGGDDEWNVRLGRTDYGSLPPPQANKRTAASEVPW